MDSVCQHALKLILFISSSDKKFTWAYDTTSQPELSEEMGQKYITQHLRSC